MTFDEVMKKYGGFWENDFAFIRDSGYVWKVATGSPKKYALTWDGKRYVTSEVAPEVAPVATEDKPKRGRKPTVVLESANE